MSFRRGPIAAAVLTAGALLFAPFLSPALDAGEKTPPGTNTTAPVHTAWDPDTVALFEKLPVQEGGRIKPLSTYAGFLLLRINGDRKYRMLDDSKHSPTEWLLDCLFFPDVARLQKTFRIENDEVLDAAELGHEGKRKRDRYSYAELAEGADRIAQLGNEYQRIEIKDRSPVEAQMVLLARNMQDFQHLTHFLDFARRTYPTVGDPELEQLYGGAEALPFSQVIAKGSELSKLLAMPHDHGDEGAHGHGGSARSAYDTLLGALEQGSRRSQILALFPPTGEGEDKSEWLSPLDVAQASFGPEPLTAQVAALATLEKLVEVRSDPAAFHKAAGEFHAATSKLAEARGEYSKVPLEVSFYKADYFTNALVLFLLGFVLVALTWLMPQSRKLERLAPWPVILGLVLVTVGITMRCIIRGRPPVSTLYETILFIAGTAVLAGLVTEWINRKKVALALSTVFGALGMFLAFKYETHEAVDTMPSLVAVLDTNFWLATHVTTVTIGYSAGLLAGFVGHVWLLGKMFGFKRGDAGFYKTVTRMTYGLICFGLVFSVVGTVLGGIWANDSWGRFWGWDPKENGALLICLWELAILHARMGGYIRDRGLAVAAVIGGCVVAFSWWGVNLLGVGLHSYGFTTGAALGLKWFYWIEGIVLCAAAVHWFFLWMIARSHAAQAGPTLPPTPPTPPSPTV